MKFNRDKKLNCVKFDNDAYFTPIELSKRLIDKTLEFIGIENITEIIEPCAGNGSFSKQILNCIAYDIDSKDKTITQQDFLTLKLEYKKGRLFITNPPFGPQNFLSVKFYSKCCDGGDYIAFIQPISQYSNSFQLYKFDLIYSEDLGFQNYSGRDIHCCFNIYSRPKSGILNKQKRWKFDDFKIFERRNVKGNIIQFKSDYDFRICGWGAKCGKILDNTEIYAKEYAFKIYNPKLKDKIYNCIKNIDLIKDFNIVSTPNISMQMLYRYLQNKIPELK
jgi:hypothetical protein